MTHFDQALDTAFDAPALDVILLIWKDQFTFMHYTTMSHSELWEPE